MLKAFYDSEHKWASICQLLFLASLLGVLFYIGPLETADSATYTNNSQVRSGLYPLLLDMNQLLFGESYWFTVVWQLLLGVGAAVYLSRWLVDTFECQGWPQLLLSALLIMPYYGPATLGNAIMSEAVCYPIFLIFFAWIGEGLLKQNIKRLYLAMFLTALLIFARKQFIFLYVLWTIVIVYMAFYWPMRRPWAKIILAFILMVVATVSVERVYQYSIDGHFKPVPFFGIQFVNAPLYVSEKEDVELFEDANTRQIFTETYARMEQFKVLKSSYKPDVHYHYNYYTHFFGAYNQIVWQSLAPVLGRILSVDYHAIDKVTVAMALKLIQEHPVEWGLLYMNNILFHMGGYYTVALVGLLTLISFFLVLKDRGNGLSLLVLLATLLQWGNYMLVAIVEPVIPRYKIYTDAVLIAVIVALVAGYLMKRKDMEPIA